MPSPTAELWAPCAYAASRVAEGSRGSDHLDVRELFDEPCMRQAVLRWLIRRREPAGRLDDPWEFFKGEPHSVTPRGGDAAWILADLAWGADREERRLLLGLAYRAATAEDVERIDAAGDADPELTDLVDRRRVARASPPEPYIRDWQVEDAKRAEERAEIERKNRGTLLANVERIAAGEDPSLLRFLVGRMEEKRRNRWGHTNWRSLVPLYGEDVAEAARSGLRLFWRGHTPMLRNERAKTNEVEWFVPVGLTGLNIAFDDGLDPMNLSDDDVVLATRFALREMNAFPEWFARLAEARPAGVLGVMEEVLAAEYSGRSAATTDRLIADIHYRDTTIKRLVVPVLVDLLTAREAEDPDVLEEALRIVGTEAGSRSSGLVAAARGRASLGGGAAGVAWWKFLVPLDPVAALGVLERQAERADEAALTAMQTVIAGVDWSKLELSPTAWKALILLTYRSVRPADDVSRAGGGIYTPDLRDEAQDKRSAIVSRA